MRHDDGYAEDTAGRARPVGPARTGGDEESVAAGAGRPASFVAALAPTVAAALLLVAPAPAHAQAGTVGIEGFGGGALPSGDFAQLPFSDVAPVGGVAATYEVVDRVAVRVGADWQRWSGDLEANPDAPDIDLLHYTAGVELDLTPDGATRWEIRLHADAGGATLDTDPFPTADGTVAPSETRFAGGGGGSVGYRVSPRVDVFVGGQGIIASADPDVHAQLNTLNEQLDLTKEVRNQRAADQITTFPLYGGVRITF